MQNQNNYIVQVSDTHLFGDKNRRINGANSYLNFKKVISHINSLKEKPGLIVVTGDLSQDCTFESYYLIADVLNKCGIRYSLLPGNHDDVDVINKIFDYNWLRNSADYFFEFNGWLIYIIDTAVYPHAEGELSSEQLLNLSNCLKQYSKNPTLVFMHHHPVQINSSWMDKMILTNHNDFTGIINKHSQVKAVLFGHIHQVFEKHINNTFYASAPSTSFQVLPNCEMFALEKLTPGYRLIQLNENEISSRVIWVD